MDIIFNTLEEFGKRACAVSEQFTGEGLDELLVNRYRTLIRYAYSVDARNLDQRKNRYVVRMEFQREGQEPRSLPFFCIPQAYCDEIIRVAKRTEPLQQFVPERAPPLAENVLARHAYLVNQCDLFVTSLGLNVGTFEWNMPFVDATYKVLVPTENAESEPAMTHITCQSLSDVFKLTGLAF